MKIRRIVRAFQAVAAGAIMLQASGCTTAQFVELVQTVLLGVTAAGSIAIIQNI